MAITEAQKRAVRKYKETNYDRVELSVPKGRKAEVKIHAEQQGETLNGFINRAIGDTIERDQANAATQAPETPEGDDLILRELGYDPLVKKALFAEKFTGKHYFVEAVNSNYDDGEILEAPELDW